jgi:DNA-binding NtrC family response regulator
MAPQIETERAARPVVLFVDDEPGLRALAADILATSGFEVLVAADGLEAIKHLTARSDIQVLISDIQMPKVGGELLAAVAQARNPMLKVALITGYVDEAIQLLERDNWRIVLKPFDIERLPALATELLRGASEGAYEQAGIARQISR